MTSPTLLGYLARFASFTMQSEVLCTQGLAYLLKTHKVARSALADEVKTRTGIAIGDSITWLAEPPQKDLARPDLEARMADRVPVVKIEAKLGAELFASQLKSYEADLRKRNTAESVLLVLVPTTRIAEAARVTAEAFDQSGSGPWRVTEGRLSGAVVVSVISWDELFAALEGRAAERFEYEFEQLKSMYYELSSDFIAPLASDENVLEWRSSDTDFVKLVDQVTRRLTNQHRVYPMQTELIEQGLPGSEPGEHRFRYVCPCASNATSCFSIGVRDPFEEWVTPVWMRFHKDTGDFSRIRQRIESSNLRSLQSGGHVWIPLDVLPNVAGELMVEALAEQAEEVLREVYRTA